MLAGRRACFRAWMGLAGLLSLAFPPRAAANPFAFFGLGSRGASLAGAMTAIVDDQASTLYNPAGAAASPDLRVTVGGAFDSHLTEAGPFATVEENVFIPWVGVAFAIPMGGIFKEKLYSALTIGLPTKNARLIRILLTPPDVPYFVPYTNETERLTITPVFAARPFPFLMLGGGFEIFPFESPNQITGAVGVTGDLEVSGTLKLATYFQARGGIILDLGEIWPELKTLRLGVAFHDSFEERFGLPAALDLGFPATLQIRGKIQFMPAQVSGGIGYDPLPDLTLSFDLAWQKWSDHPSPRLEMGIQGLENLVPLEQIADVFYDPPRPALHDTLSPRLGAELRAPRWSWALVAWRVGYAFEPSPGPATKEDPLLFANTRHVIGAGLSFQPAAGLLSEAPIRFSFDLSLQAHLLEPQKRTVPAELTQSGEPEVVTGEGTVFSVALSLITRY